MNQFFILNYINKLTKNDIVNFASKQNISLRDDEIDIIYSYIKTRYSDFFAGREKELLLEIKEQVSSSTYLKILEYYQLYLEKVKNKKL